MSILKELRAPVFKAGGMPPIDLKTYILSLNGLVKKAKDFS